MSRAKALGFYEFNSYIHVLWGDFMIFQDDMNFFEAIKKGRDTYTNEIILAHDAYKTAVDTAKQMFRPAHLKNALESAKSDFDKAKRKAEFKFLSDCDSFLSEAEKECTSRLIAPDAKKLAEVKQLQGLKFTPREFTVLCRRSGWTLDYYVCKVLRQIADDNGICIEDLPSDIKLLPEYDEQLNVLSEFKQGIEDYVAEYAPDNDLPSVRMLISDTKIGDWESRYSNGLRSAKTLSDDAQLRRFMTSIEGAGNEAEKGKEIKTALSGVDDGLRARLLFEIADSRIVSDIAVKMSGCADEIEAFRNGGTKEYKEAVSAMEKVKGAGTSLHAKEIARANRHNKYFTSELKREAVNDSKLQDVSEFVGECLADDTKKTE